MPQIITVKNLCPLSSVSNRNTKHSTKYEKVHKGQMDGIVANRLGFTYLQLTN